MTGWTSQTIRGTNQGRLAVKGREANPNALANRRALKELSDCEFTTGMTADELRDHQRQMRERMLERMAKERKAA